MTDAYRDDLAFIHDVGFGGVAECAAPVLIEALRHGGHGGGLVVDLGCGGGILSRRVVDAGYGVLGIDLAPAMLAIARRRVPEATFRGGSLLAAEFPPCVGVAAVGECFNYLFDSTNSARALGRLLRRAFGALAPGGVLLCDVAGPGRVPAAGPQKSHAEGDGWAVLVTAEEDRRSRRLTRRITSFRRAGEHYRRDEEVHRLRLIPPGEFAGRLRAVGWRVRELRGYGPFRFQPGWTGFLARKAGVGAGGSAGGRPGSG